MSDLILFTNPMSRGRIARWGLEEVGAPYQTKVVTYGPEMKGPDYTSINPMGKVPALKHGDQIITETPAILAYLADAFPEAGLAPSLDQRGAYYRWLFWGAACWEPAVFSKAMGFEPDEKQQTSIGFGNYDLVLDTFESHMKANDFVAGNAFTMADVYMGAEIAFALQFKSIESRPVFEEYVARVSSREAYRKADELDNALMAEAEANKSG